MLFFLPQGRPGRLGLMQFLGGWESPPSMTEPPSVTVSLCDLGQLTDPLWASVLSPGERCLHCPRGPHQDGRSEKNGVLPRRPP